MSSASSALGALAVLSIILATTAGTDQSEITGRLGVTGSIAHHRANGTGVSSSAVTEATTTTTTKSMMMIMARGTTTTTTTTTTERRTSYAAVTENGSSSSSERSTGDPEITAAASIAAVTTASEATVTASPVGTSAYTEEMTTTAKASTTPHPPRQERLVGLAGNETTTTISELPGDEATTRSAVAETTTTTAGLTTQTTHTTQPTQEPMVTQAQTTSGVVRSALGSKTRNDLVGGTFHEIKPAQKINSVGYFGGKMMKPNVNSVLGKYAPYFEDGQTELNVTARIGSTVVLDCEIGMLGNKTVTWSYHSADVFRLLTVGRSAYSVDQRISLFFRYPTNWRLRIQYATPRDSGLYECQVATYPPLVKKIHLLVTAPILVIMDDSGRIKSGERHLKAGSSLHLRCEARDVPERYNETVIWTRGDEILNEDVSENRTIESVDGREIQVIVSTIVIERATPRHAGNYSCVVPEKAKATVAVHVLNGELPAAVHDGNGVSRSVLNLWLIHLTVSYVFSR